MNPLPAPRSRGAFRIVLFCAKKEEAECAHDALDEKWDAKQYGKERGDDNAYTLGRMGEHYVVIIHMPGMGTDRAAVAKAGLKISFPNVRLALVIGVCGGMPYGPGKEETILGDVVISDSLVRYDIGRRYDQGFERKTDIHDVLGPPTEKILGVIRRLETRDEKAALRRNMIQFLSKIQEKSPETRYPGSHKDILYDSAYTHQHRPLSECNICRDGRNVCQTAVDTECEDLECSEDASMCVLRSRLTGSLSPEPAIHFGTMASGNTVMKSGHYRDALAKEGVRAIEMEGAGVWRYGPTIVIKGICDYGDSHKRNGWQRYAAATAAACTKAFLLEWEAEQTQDCLVHTEANIYFKVPENRVETLYGRDDELTKIATFFDDSSRRNDRPCIMILQAMGGQGKSQIALEYCHRILNLCTHHAIFWLDGSSSLAIVQSWIAIARHIDNPATDILTDDDTRVKSALSILEKYERRWLIVFDNCDDPTIFPILRKKFLPKVGKGDILFTSRHHGLAEIGYLMKIPPMPCEAGVQLLLHRYGPDIDHSKHMIEGLQIVKRLGYLALAIDQASAYMQYRQLSLDELHSFLPLYNSRREKVLRHTTSEFWNYLKVDGLGDQQIALSAFTTWEMSFQQLLDRHENRSDLEHFFTLSAFLGPTFVHEELFQIYWAMHRPQTAWTKLFLCHSRNVALGLVPSQITGIVGMEPCDDAWDPDSFWDLAYRAFRTALIQNLAPAAGSGGTCFLFHPLIRDWLQLRLTLEHRQTFTREATTVVSNSVQVYKIRDSGARTRARLLLHVDSVMACDNEFFPPERRLGHDISTCDNTHWIASFYRDEGQYSISLCLFRIETITRISVLGKEHPLTLSSMNDLAKGLGNKGEYSEAEHLLRQVVDGWTQALGEEHRETLVSKSNLAIALRDQGKRSEAEQIHRQVREVRERVLGRNHPDTLINMNSLALILWDQGEYSEAEHLLRQVVDGWTQALGEEHPDTLTSINNLALTLSDQGKWGEAERMYHRALEILRQVSGKEHPDTLRSTSNLVGVLINQARYNEAEQMCRQVIEGWTRVLGKNHPDTLISMNNLAILLSDQGKLTEAEEIQLQVVRSSFALSGSQHPNFKAFLNILLLVLDKQGRGTSEIETIVMALCTPDW